MGGACLRRGIATRIVDSEAIASISFRHKPSVQRCRSVGGIRCNGRISESLQAQRQRSIRREETIWAFTQGGLRLGVISFDTCVVTFTASRFLGRLSLAVARGTLFVTFVFNVVGVMGCGVHTQMTRHIPRRAIFMDVDGGAIDSGSNLETTGISSIPSRYFRLFKDAQVRWAVNVPRVVVLD